MLHHGLVFKKVRRVIGFKWEAWLKPYIDIRSELREKAKNKFEKDFFKLMNYAVSRKTIKKCKKSQRYQACNSRTTQELFGVGTKLS